MPIKSVITAAIVVLTLAMAGCTPPNQTAVEPPWPLKTLIEPVQQAVVTVVNYDVEGNATSVGSGFFISDTGILLTSLHVLDGAYSADVRTADGTAYPITAILSASPLVDLAKVRVQIPTDRFSSLRTAGEVPAPADRIFVVGSPMGLTQTVSEGIVSAVRDAPAGGKVLQLTAPISQGSSGGPVVNQRGEAVGVVTFQSARGQNLNFAVSIDALHLLPETSPERSIAEWTIDNARQTPAVAAALCSQGARLSIQGEYEAALDYFKRAAEANPEDPDAWYGLGSCYVGLDQPDDAVRSFLRPIEQDPDNATAHFILAMYFKSVGRYDREIDALSEVIRIDPVNLQARFELGRAYGELSDPDAQIRTFQGILDDQPDHLPTLIGLGAALAENGHLEQALPLLGRAEELEPGNPLVHYNIGVMYSRLDRPEEAARAYIRAIRIDPAMAPAHLNLGLTYVQQGNLKRALGQYEILKGFNDKMAGRLFEKIYPESSSPASE